MEHEEPTHSTAPRAELRGSAQEVAQEAQEETHRPLTQATSVGGRSGNAACRPLPQAGTAGMRWERRYAAAGAYKSALDLDLSELNAL